LGNRSAGMVSHYGGKRNCHCSEVGILVLV
jgi:hypothetical protein